MAASAGAADSEITDAAAVVESNSAQAGAGEAKSATANGLPAAAFAMSAALSPLGEDSVSPASNTKAGALVSAKAAPTDGTAAEAAADKPPDV